MDLETLLSFEWGAMMPEFIILIAATVLTLMDLFMGKGKSRKILGWIGLAGIVLAIISLVTLLDNEVTTILFDTFRLDSFAKAFKFILLVGAGLVMLLAISYEPKHEFEEYRGEFYYLFLTALLGAMMVASSGDLITLFVGLELLSMSSFVLAGLQKKNIRSNESAMKYVIMGGVSTAITLFGMSYVFGLTGTTNIADMREILVAITDPQLSFLLTIAFLLLFVGLSFKISAAPFHMWTPDVYEGAPTPVTVFLSVISKTAGFVLLIRIIISIFLVTPATGAETMPIVVQMGDYIAAIAAVTMIIGNVVALKQQNIKRLFAYSSISHAGYILVAISALSVFMFDSLWFYLVAYLFMNFGAFAIIQLLTEKENGEELFHFAGLYQRSPFLALSMGVMILSLAGIPATAGFIGKLNIITGALVTEDPAYVLVSIMIATTVISYVYYFRILRQMFFVPADVKTPIKVPATIGVVIGICVVATLVLGLFPNVAFDFLQTNFMDFGDFFQ